jgi:hypothetical protein
MLVGPLIDDRSWLILGLSEMANVSMEMNGPGLVSGQYEQRLVWAG